MRSNATTSAKPISFDELIGGRRNNLDAIRVVLALAVVLFHSYLFAPGPEREFVGWISGGTVDLGFMAVAAFFAISGLLITASWERNPQLGVFLRSRALRIYPGFLAVTAFCLLVVGPIGATDVGQYFRDLEVRNILDAAFLNKISSPPTFGDVSGANSLNGSLWTIKIEFEFYIFTVLLGAFGLIRRKQVIGLLAVGFLVGGWIVSSATLFDLVPGSVRLASYNRHILLGTFYMAGASFYLYRAHIPRRRSLLVASVTIWTVSALLEIPWLIGPIAFTYAVFYIAYERNPRLADFSSRGDISYGLYLFGWPIQLLVAHFIGQSLNPYIFFVLCIAPLTLVAVLSWRLIERPALALKKRRTHVATPPRELVE